MSDIENMHTRLKQTLDAYHAAHTKALRKLYRHFPSAIDTKGVQTIHSHRALDSRPYVHACRSEQAKTPTDWPFPRNEEVLIVYWFCFNLEEFAKEEVRLSVLHMLSFI